MTASQNEDFAPVGYRSWAFLLAIALFLLVVASAIGYILLYGAGCGAATAETPAEEYTSVVIGIIAALAFATLGVIILRYQPQNRVGWLCLVGGFGLSVFPRTYVDCALDGVLPETGIAYLALWNYAFASLLGVLPIFILLPLWFPDGQFLNSRFRKLSIVILALILILSFALALVPDFRQNNGVGTTYPLDNPLGISQLPQWWGLYIGRILNLLLIFAALVGVLSMILRLKCSRGVERQQMKWFVYFLATAVATQLIFFELAAVIFAPYLIEGSALYTKIFVLYALILTIVFLGFPLTIGIAVFKYRLYDIDVIIRRTLVYAALSATLALVFFGVVTLLQSLFVAVSGQRSAVATVISTLVIAALFTPLRNRIQNDIDRRFYRKKYDAEQVVAAFSAGLREEVDLDDLQTQILAVVEETLQPEHVSLWLKPVENRERSGSMYYGQ